MLGDKFVATALPVADLDRAASFYEEKLGLKRQSEFEGGVSFEAGEGTGLFLYQRGPTKADHTVAGFRVDDVEKEVGELRAKGVEFEEYDIPEMGIKTENGIATMGDIKSAWFKDLDGNILAINQM